MKIIKVETDIFFMGKHEAGQLKEFLSDIPDNTKIFFVTGTGRDLLFKKDGEILDSSMQDWKDFWCEAWTKLTGSIEEGREKFFNDLPDSYFDKVFNKFSKQ